MAIEARKIPESEWTELAEWTAATVQRFGARLDEHKGPLPDLLHRALRATALSSAERQRLVKDLELLQAVLEVALDDSPQQPSIPNLICRSACRRLVEHCKETTVVDSFFDAMKCAMLWVICIHACDQIFDIA
jgi:hypothetical protein